MQILRGVEVCETGSKYRAPLEKIYIERYRDTTYVPETGNIFCSKSRDLHNSFFSIVEPIQIDRVNLFWSASLSIFFSEIKRA